MGWPNPNERSAATRNGAKSDSRWQAPVVMWDSRPYTGQKSYRHQFSPKSEPAADCIPEASPARALFDAHYPHIPTAEALIWINLTKGSRRRLTGALLSKLHH
jgi:hypothetical protein